MRSLCVKTNNSNLLDYLLNELKYIELDNVCFSSNTFKHYKNIIIHYYGQDVNKFISKISYLLSFLIIDELEDSFLKTLLCQNYFYFDSEERSLILNNCYDILSDDYYKWFDKKINCLYNSFYDFISENKSIVLSGFINFRVKKYFEILEEITNEAVNSYIIEKEYLEFISLLKLYVNSQSANSDVVHLVYSTHESILLDDKKSIINCYDDLFNAKYLSDISFSSHDYALNTLLNLLPKKIYIHLIDGIKDEFINTLQLVFEKRVELCIDCDICSIYKSKINATNNINLKN